MLLLFGIIFVFACTFGGYIAMGGKMAIIIKAAPLELVVILGSGIGAFVISNPTKILKQALPAWGKAAKGSKRKADDYKNIMLLMYQIFKMVKSKGVLAIEAHVETPEESTLFANYPKIQKDHHLMEFICDYLRLWTLGTENPHDVEPLLDAEIEKHHHDDAHIAHAYQSLADALPALGIVAAVLGVIKTMASISEPPEVLGKMIGGALVGTFLGVFLAYGFVGPLATSLNNVSDAETDFYKVIKAGLVAHMTGFAPMISMEFMRKTISHQYRPSFLEMEEAVNELPPA